MIQITKERKGPAPEGLKKGMERAGKLLEEYNDIAKKTINPAARQKKETEWLKDLKIESKEYATEDTKKQLYISHFGKCAYCETRIVHSHYGDVEHYRPKKGVDTRTREGKRLTIMDAYFWHAFDWDNLVLSCGICNQYYKKNYFELLPDLTPTKEEEEYTGEGPLKLSKTEPQRQNPSRPDLGEAPVLIDVCLENPRFLISFNPRTGMAEPSKHIDLSGGDKKLNFAKAAATIKVLGLNRIALLELRRRHLLLLHAVFLVALNDWFSLKTIKEFGKTYKEEPLIDTRGDLLRNHLKAQMGSKPEAQKAIELLGWYAHSGGEYSAMATDAICQWSLEEYEEKNLYSGKAPTQSIDDKLYPIGATVNEYYKIPVTFHETQKIQFTNYEEVIKQYLREHDYEAVEPSAIRRPLHERMNELIRRYEINYKLLESYWSLGEEARCLEQFKEHIDHYRTQLLRHIEQYEDEKSGKGLSPVTSFSGSLKPVSDTVPDNSHLDFHLRVLADLLKKFDYLFSRIPVSKSLSEADAIFNNSKFWEDVWNYFTEVDKFTGKVKDAEQTIPHWKKEVSFFMQNGLDYLNKSRYKEKVEPEVLEEISEEFHSILLGLTELLFEVNSCGVVCTAITNNKDARAEELKSALASILFFLTNSKGKMPKMAKLSLIKIT